MQKFSVKCKETQIIKIIEVWKVGLDMYFKYLKLLAVNLSVHVVLCFFPSNFIKELYENLSFEFYITCLTQIRLCSHR